MTVPIARPNNCYSATNKKSVEQQLEQPKHWWAHPSLASEPGKEVLHVQSQEKSLSELSHDAVGKKPSFPSLASEAAPPGNLVNCLHQHFGKTVLGKLA